MNINPSNFYENYYMNHSSGLNKDNIFNNMKQTSLNNKNNTEEKKEEIVIEKIKEPEYNVSKEEAIALVYQYQSTQIMKSQIDTYFDSHENQEEQEELTMQDFRDVNKILNRSEMIKYYQEEERLRIQEDQNHTQVWA